MAYVDEPFNIHHPYPGASSARFPHTFMRLDTASGELYRAPLARALEFRYDWSDAAAACLRSPSRTPRAALDASRCTLARLRHARALVKDPLALLSAEWLADTFGMQVVVMIRHPAGVAASIIRLGWQFDFGNFTSQPALMAGDLASIADEVEQAAKAPPPLLEQAALLWKALYLVVLRYRAQRPSWIMLRHEDISNAPTLEFSKLCSDLAVGDPEAVLRRAKATSGTGNPAEAPAGVPHALRRDSSSAATAWKHRLTPAQTGALRDKVEDVACYFYGDDEWK